MKIILYACLVVAASQTAIAAEKSDDHNARGRLKDD